MPQPAHRQYPYLNVLDGHLSNLDGKVFVEIRTLALREQEGVACIKGTVEADDAQKAEAWLQLLLDRAYGKYIYSGAAVITSSKHSAS